jgi:hypothetical protein
MNLLTRECKLKLVKWGEYISAALLIIFAVAAGLIGLRDLSKLSVCLEALLVMVLAVEGVLAMRIFARTVMPAKMHIVSSFS